MNRKLFLLAILPVMLVGCSGDGEEKEILPVEAQDIKMSSDFIQVEKGKNVAISAIVMPENAICKDVIWTSSDYTIADFIDGGVVGFSKGKCSIFASTKDGKIKKECKVEVTPVKISEIYLEETVNKIFEGNSLKIDYKTYPYDAENKNVVISSSDPNIVTVDPDGKTLHAKTVGKAVITLKAEYGDCSIHYEVQVVNDIMSAVDFVFSDHQMSQNDFIITDGYITGDTWSYIKSIFPKEIELTRVEVTNSKTQTVFFYTEDASKLGIIKSGGWIDLIVYLTYVYKPIMTWYFKCLGEDYKISKPLIIVGSDTPI